MYKDLERTCTAIVLLIKHFVRWRARCCRRGRRRGLLKVTRWRASQVKRWFRLPVPSFVICLQPMLFLCERARATAKQDGKYDYSHHPSWFIFCFCFR